MLQLQRGIRGKIEDYIDISRQFQVISETIGNAEYDTSCFGVDSDGKLSDDRYMIFYNQPSSPDNEITMSESGNSKIYSVDLSSLPLSINKLVFTVSIDGNQTMGEINSHRLCISQNGSEIMELVLSGANFNNERAIIDIEIYRKNEWRFNVVAGGYNGGLSELLNSFGGTAEEDIQQPVQQPVSIVKAPEPAVFDKPAADTEKAVLSINTAEPFENTDKAVLKKETLPCLGKNVVSLKKDDRVRLQNFEYEPFMMLMVGLGWDMSQSGANVDCDSSAILCKNGRLADRKKDIVCFYHLKHKSGAVKHMGDNLTGFGSGDDERMIVDISKIPRDYDAIVFVVNIYSAHRRNQHFGMINNCYIRVCDEYGNELCRYNLSDNYYGMTAMIFGEIVKTDCGWVFHAIGQGTEDDDIGELADRFK